MYGMTFVPGTLAKVSTSVCGRASQVQPTPRQNPIKRAERVVPASTPHWPALHHQKDGPELPKKNTPVPAMQGGGISGLDF
jgi:hypothetical protein